MSKGELALNTFTAKLKYGLAVLSFVTVLLSLQLILAPKANATTYNVNTVSDPTGCGFLEALAEINATPIPGATCPAASAPNTINVAAGTYTLPTAIPPLTTDGDLTIVGENPITTIINGAGFSGITINPPSATNTYSISNMTFENFTQVPVFPPQSVITIASGSTSVNNIVARNNSCTDLGSIPSCAFFAAEGSGGSNVTITNSAFYLNTAPVLVYISATSNDMAATITNNTFSSNNGAALQLLSTSDNLNISATITNNTFANNNINTSDYPIPPSAFAGASTAMNFNFENGFAEMYNGTFTIKNNILSNNTIDGTTPANCQDPAKTGDNTTITSLGGNISSDNTCSSYFTNTNDLNNTDPQLQALTQLGTTFVRPIGNTSPAYNNAIATGAPSTDQRGVSRPQNGAYDSGAFEYVGPAPSGGSGSGASLASTGWDTKIPSLVAGLLLFSGLMITGYSIKRR